MGYSFRSRLEASECGGVAVIQMKDLLDDNTVGCGGLVRIDMEVDERTPSVRKEVIWYSDPAGMSTTAAVLLDDPGKAVSPLLY
jgi:hypothetical protein